MSFMKIFIGLFCVLLVNTVSEAEGVKDINQNLPIDQKLNPQVPALITKSLQVKDYKVVRSTQVNQYLKEGYHLGGFSCINDFETTPSGMIAFKSSVCLQAVYRYK